MDLSLLAVAFDAPEGRRGLDVEIETFDGVFRSVPGVRVCTPAPACGAVFVPALVRPPLRLAAAIRDSIGVGVGVWGSGAWCTNLFTRSSATAFPPDVRLSGSNFVIELTL